VTLDDDDAPHPLLELASFGRFQAGIANAAPSSPVAVEVTVVGSYGLDISS